MKVYIAKLSLHYKGDGYITDFIFSQSEYDFNKVDNGFENTQLFMYPCFVPNEMTIMDTVIGNSVTQGFDYLPSEKELKTIELCMRQKLADKIKRELDEHTRLVQSKIESVLGGD